MSEPTTVPCWCCNGTGRVKLAGVYLDTLALLAGQGRPTSGAALARLAGCSGPAMSNRLVVLERLGLASSRRDGRKRLFRVAEGNADA